MRIKKASRLLVSAAAAAGLVFAIVAGAAGPAEAADGNVYVVVNNSVCSSGSEVRGILINDAQSGFTTTAWDNGDNIVYPRVRFGIRNQLSIQARCDKRVALFFWQPVGYRTVVAFITPTSAGQTFWVG